MMMDIDYAALRADQTFCAAESLAGRWGLTQIKTRRWNRRRGATVHIIFHESGAPETITYKMTIAVKRKRTRSCMTE